MPLKGTFIADFSSFQDAVHKAEVSLKGFEGSAAKVGTALNRAVDSFSGRQVISQASLMVEAVDRVGGVSKLTQNELARVGSVATEAAAKLKAMGQDVPPGIQRIADATRTTTGFFQDLGKQVVATAAGFVSAQAVLHLVRLGFDAVKDAAKSMWDIALSGAAVADVEENFQRLTSQAGLLGDTLLGTLRSGTHATITDFELMKTVNQDLAAGMRLTDAQFGTLAKGAFALAQATGGDVKTALDTMNDAMLTGRTRSLALLTGKIDLEAAEQKFAASIGTTAKNLSEAGKLEAARVAILDGVSAATARLGVQTDGLDERVAQAQASWGNFKEELGKTIATSSVLEAGLVGLAQGLTSTFGSDKQALVAAIARKIDEAAIGLIGLAQTAVTTSGAIVTGFYAVKKVFGDVAQIIDGVTLATLYLGKAQLALPNAIGLGTEAWKANDAAIGKLLDTMLVRGKALQADDQAQSGVNATTQKYIATLEGVRAKMMAAGASGAQVAAALSQVAGAQAVVNAGAQAGAAAWTSNASALKTATEAAKAHSALMNEIGEKQMAFMAADMKVAAAEVESALTVMREEFARVTASDAKLLASEIDSVVDAMVADIAQARIVMTADAKAMADEIQSAMVASIGAVTSQVNFLTSSFAQLGPTIMSALQGGGDVIKSVAGLFGGQLTKSIFGGDAMKNSIKDMFGATLGSAFNALLPGIGALAGPLISKIAGLFKGVFGASEKELAGRDVAAKFREELERTLTVTQKLEAGTDQWKKSVIAIRDAYIAHGRSGEEALVISERLWRAEKEGPEAVKRVIEEVAAVMSGTFANALVTTGVVAQETLAGVADAAVGEMNRIADSIRYYDRGTGQTGEDARRMSPGEAQAYIDAFVAKGGSAAFAQAFLEANPGDEGRLDSAAFDYRPYQGQDKEEFEKGQMGFAGGTGGKYLDFGSGTNVVLHGREKVTTATQGQSEATAWAGMESRLRSIEQMLGRFPLQIRDAILLTR